MKYPMGKISRRLATGLAVMCSLVMVACAGFVPQNESSSDVSGTWKSVSHSEVAPMTLTKDGQVVTGTLKGSYTLKGDQIKIVLQFNDNFMTKYEMNGRVKGNSLLMERKDGDVTIFNRADAQATSSPSAQNVYGSQPNDVSQPGNTQPLAPPSAPSGVRSQSRRVSVNNVRISDEKLRAIEQQFQFYIPDGDYWYDKMCGAWGFNGGPTRGFTWPALDLGGPMRADASRGRTRVFVNGRQLHTLDVQALQKLGPVYPGRYWLDAQGNVGYEGGPAFANLVQLSQQAGGRRRGGRHGSILSGMYDSGIGAAYNGGFISGNTGATWDTR